MTTGQLLLDAFGRIHRLVHRTVAGLDPEGLALRVAPDANPIGWLVWHLTRVQDDHVSEIAGHEQMWAAGGWAPRFGLVAGTFDTGYGHTPSQVEGIRPDSPAVLTDYHDAVFAATSDYVGRVTDADLDRIIDRSYDPPVSVGVRLVSVIGDDLQHLGQAAYVRGLMGRTG